MSTWWVGGYGPDMKGTLPGILALETQDDGTLALVGTAVETPSPSYLVRHGDHVYAVAEGAGTVESFRRTGQHTLERDGSVPTGGAWPCSLDFSAGGIAVANYFDGSVAVISLDERGAVVSLVDREAGSGSGPHARQEGPHAHAVVTMDPTTLASVDLGSDRVRVHRPGLRVESSLALPPGTGPRDLVRAPSGLYYLLGELSNELFVLRWTGSAFDVLSSVAVPGAEVGDFASGISQWRDFVYVGLRGSDRITMLRADGDSLEPLGSVAAEGEWPRHHAVDGDVLHVAHELSNSIGSFRLGGDGVPRLIAAPTAVHSPNYLLRAG